MKFWKLVLTATALVISSSVNAALVERLGGLAYYDTDADLTWLADANYAQTSGHDADGKMTWQQSKDWAADLTVAGVGGWRLANTIDVGNDGATYSNIFQGVDYGYNITTHSELSNMFFNVLGNGSLYDTNGSMIFAGLSNTGPFSNLQPGSDGYWSATEYAANTNSAWLLYMTDGIQSYGHKATASYAWAVQPGDVSAVPVPAAVWLFGSGLVGLIGIARRKKS